jgi:hypothetical protein
MNAVAAMGILLAAYSSWPLAVLIGVLLVLTIIAISFLYRHMYMSWVGLMALMCILIGGMNVNTYMKLKDKPVVKNISVRDIGDYREAGGFYFSDAMIRDDLSATYIRRSSNTGKSSTSSISFYYAAPMVFPGWTAENSVGAWVVAQNIPETKNWKENYQAAILADPIFSEEFRVAVENAVVKHQLKTDEKPLLLKWVPSPEKAISGYLSDAQTYCIWFNGIMLAGMMIVFGVRYFKLKKLPDPALNDMQLNDMQRSTENSVPVPGKANMIRFLFVVYCFFMFALSVFFSGMNVENILAILVLIIAIIVYIIASATLQMALKKENQPLRHLLLIGLAPYLFYYLLFSQLNYTSRFFWAFPGFFYFLMIAGGFLLGIVLAPMFAKFKAAELENSIGIMVRFGISYGKNLSGFIFPLMIVLGVLSGLSYALIDLLSVFTHLPFYRQVIFYTGLGSGMALVIRITYRQTVFYQKENNRQ